MATLQPTDGAPAYDWVLVAVTNADLDAGGGGKGRGKATRQLLVCC